MSKNKNYKGLKFNYRVEQNEKYLMDKYKTIEDFLNTEFPKNNNPLSPINDSEIFAISWNGHIAKINNYVKTLSDLKKILTENVIISKSDIRLSKHDFSGRHLERKSVHSIEEIRELIKDVLIEKRKSDSKVELDGDIIKGNSERYQTFFIKGFKCACCGIEGKYFAKEKHSKDASYHLNLYAIDNNGKEALMTKDHILPKSKGGKDDIDNYQPMCEKCNNAKGNNIE